MFSGRLLYAQKLSITSFFSLTSPASKTTKTDLPVPLLHQALVICPTPKNSLAGTLLGLTKVRTFTDRNYRCIHRMDLLLLNRKVGHKMDN